MGDTEKTHKIISMEEFCRNDPLVRLGIRKWPRITITQIKYSVDERTLPPMRLSSEFVLSKELAEIWDSFPLQQ